MLHAPSRGFAFIGVESVSNFYSSYRLNPSSLFLKSIEGVFLTFVMVALWLTPTEVVL